MQGNGTKCERVEDSPDVDLWPAGRANMKSVQVEVDEFLHELEDLITRRWDLRRVGTLIERIQYNENWALAWQYEHLFQAVLQGVVTWLSRAFAVSLINAMEDVAVRTRVGRKLSYERVQQIVTALLVEILEIEVKVGHDGRSSFANGHYVFNYRGTGKK